MTLLRAIEITNAVQSILSLALLMFLTDYLITEWHRGRLTLAKLVRWRLVPSVQCVVAMWVFNCGNMLARGLAFIWRHMLNAGFPVERADRWFLLPFIIGSAMTAIGLMCKLRVFSTPSLGHWPWMLAAATAFAAVLALAL